MYTFIYNQIYVRVYLQPNICILGPYEIIKTKTYCQVLLKVPPKNRIDWKRKVIYRRHEGPWCVSLMISTA